MCIRDSRYSALKHFTLVVIDYVGRERDVFTDLISEELPLSPKQLRALADYRGRVEIAWQTLQDAATAKSVGPVVQTAIQQANNAFLGKFEQFRVEVYQAGMSAQDYPLDASRWFDQASSTIARFHAIQELSLIHISEPTRPY